MRGRHDKLSDSRHRGYPARFPENSLRGFLYAALHHVDVIETDVQRTQDGHLVIIHDEKIDRVTSGEGEVCDMTLRQLRHWHMADGEVVPTLDELIALARQFPVRLNIEFKTGKHRYPGIEAEVHDKIKAAGLAPTTMYCSFNLDSLKIMRDIAPEQSLAFLTSGRTSAEVTAALPVVDVLHLEHYLPDVAMPQRLWTIDEPMQMLDAASKDHVVGLITNRFELAEEVLSGRV
ncbi:glycerophosphodiester phosphodiesterase [Lacticaseibacillus mingshuiensis]|uniref:glycerophosphodiester phosphodiesterase n=1 Tax=Lacticaseibacillus mingshuiensis TaxID=2799574 RepID=UPI00194E9361|nr:glycerophosphodiester phosphodiesterase family protein [Lacticaseibacillus mingshuiensis]